MFLSFRSSKFVCMKLYDIGCSQSHTNGGIKFGEAVFVASSIGRVGCYGILEILLPLPVRPLRKERKQVKCGLNGIGAETFFI
eukprot:9478950-Ditylum_brightwellii.AAC.1